MASSTLAHRQLAMPSGQRCQRLNVRFARYAGHRAGVNRQHAHALHQTLDAAQHGVKNARADGRFRVFRQSQQLQLFEQ